MVAMFGSCTNFRFRSFFKKIASTCEAMADIGREFGDPFGPFVVSGDQDLILWREIWNPCIDLGPIVDKSFYSSDVYVLGFVREGRPNDLFALC